MDLEDFQPAAAVWPVDQDLAVEPAGAQQGLIENLRAIGGAEQDYAHGRVKAVEFRQQLVECLLLLVVAAIYARGAAAAKGIELVDEDDAGSGVPRLLEEVAHTCGADADEQLDEFGARDREERNAGLAGDRAC